ncbi:similar to Saccharomyces cerevisiae YBR193C MED8 Subunit of the RNA polymerase II mediator complex [Maudiozyma barnettii]|uniref:Mediator of RNA polymerase II transcription subunit 8 n=1 Tax=Maudiozyma barnettii TaxID=61262 RepID=A0A8H2VDU1_9SACH|nr:Med8p [Kazachstania barnettii]CAB4253681.1 similar to Saccharomyces cerevisiae YBR193C MED8 Subunit of the RNA polymerase II mediator complex [Kazachstania barnettii]CAD1781396.1 similar to Saccharomyces cerevisiae YBR193C MED8 Subunit of the RNA polymerase II mediator complex [Kazachstania barnettii]
MSQNSSNILNKPTNLTLNDDMYKPDFGGVPSQALDAIRMRLAQLTHSLRKIRDDLSKAELPQWYSLQSQLNVTLTQMMSVTSTLEHFHDTLDATVVYPLPKFPTTSHETLLTTLLRKKYTPEVDEWISESRESSGLDHTQLSAKNVKQVLQKDKECTKWALDLFSSEFEKYNFKGLKTKKEELEGDLMETDYIPTSQNVKPSEAFVIEDVLNFVFRGEEKDEKLEVEKDNSITN